jgi:sigma-B regulation protein RsbU (phosphoserine phosphatase)
MEQIQAASNRTLNVFRDAALQSRLVSQRQRLQDAMPVATNRQSVVDLVRQIDSALERMDAGTFGICDTCHDTIESDRLLIDPLTRNCLDHLSPSEQRALERDLDLAFQVQRGLLPQAGLTLDGWSMAYAYEPAGPVSGDYCDVIVLGKGASLFAVGDVMGKGVAASMLMANLHAIFRSLTTITCAVPQLVASANRIFGQGTLASHFATLVCGCVQHDGDVELSNAGHCLPVHLSRDGATRIDSTGFPLGLFGEAEYKSHKLKLAPGDSLVLYTDGVSESFNEASEQYGDHRLAEALQRHRTLGPVDLVAAVLKDVKSFRGETRKSDDLTLMVLRRETGSTH